MRKPLGSEGAVFVASEPDGGALHHRGLRPAGVQAVLPAGAGIGPVRHVGEAIAVCVAATRGRGRRILQRRDEVDFEELPCRLRHAGRPRTRRAAAARAYGATTSSWKPGSMSATPPSARPPPSSSAPTLRTARQHMAPIEGRGVVAEWDRRLDQLVLHTAPRCRMSSAPAWPNASACRRRRCVWWAPDVGGGFGYKGILLPEEVAAATSPGISATPVRWIEDRRESLTGKRQLPRASLRTDRLCRPRRPPAGAGRRGHGRCRGLFGLSVLRLPEAAQVASILPGPYDFPAYRCATWSAATNKPGDPALSRRGARRRGLCDGDDDGRHRARGGAGTV
ncbi:MAG: molybdopterin cofactor-binding domain-containing protein [Acetobacteraceae bacterium]